ncbi:MAG: glutamate--tRNA ligase [Planctomycetes bacterium]|nr:glutamate--tRNA ligase [Planctomycetota bacterium]
MATAPHVITRFAPSPTGHLHIGGARTALFCWAYARRTGGTFLIRIEDTDQARSSEASAHGILKDLAWLGILWDEGPELPLVAPVSDRCGPTGSPAQVFSKTSPGAPLLAQHGSETRATGTIGGNPRGVGSFYQSQRLDVYNAVITDMLARGLAYADFSPPEKLAEARKAAEAAKQTFRYHPPAAEIAPLDEQQRRIAAGEKHVIRFRANEEPVRVTDEVLGEVAFGAGEVDDFVLRKADGYPTYHFGVVVDDEKMGVTHVLRGQEHLMNTPRHVALQQALGYRTPVYAHMPLIFNDQGAKMSKRERDQTARKAVKDAKLAGPPAGASIDAAAFTAWLGDTKRQLETGELESLAAAMNLALPEVSVDDFRKAGYLPEVICNFIALLGWNPGENREKFGMEFLAANFDLARIGKTSARFDRKKLLSFNADAIGAMQDTDLAARLLEWCAEYAPAEGERLRALGAERLALLARAVKPRARTLKEALRPAAFALVSDEELAFDPAAADKVLKANAGAGRALLLDLAKVLAALEPFEPPAINAAIEAFAAGRSLKTGDVAQPLRVAVTGSTVSPGLGETLAVLGKASTMKRIERCAAACG